MSLNSNHIFEELGEIKCSVVEKNCNAERVGFLKTLLEQNGFTVITAKSPPPKAPVKPLISIEAPIETTPAPETFTVGVTDLGFNTMNALYNRELKTFDGKIVTPAFWKQLEPVSNDDLWYWKK